MLPGENVKNWQQFSVWYNLLDLFKYNFYNFQVPFFPKTPVIWSRVPETTQPWGNFIERLYVKK